MGLNLKTAVEPLCRQASGLLPLGLLAMPPGFWGANRFFRFITRPNRFKTRVNRFMGAVNRFMADLNRFVD